MSFKRRQCLQSAIASSGALCLLLFAKVVTWWERTYAFESSCKWHTWIIIMSSSLFQNGLKSVLFNYGSSLLGLECYQWVSLKVCNCSRLFIWSRLESEMLQRRASVSTDKEGFFQALAELPKRQSKRLAKRKWGCQFQLKWPTVVKLLDWALEVCGTIKWPKSKWKKN